MADAVREGASVARAAAGSFGPAVVTVSRNAVTGQTGPRWPSVRPSPENVPDSQHSATNSISYSEND